MKDIAIRVNALSKQYQLGAKQDGYRTLRESLVDAASAPFRRFSGEGRRRQEGPSEFWALQDVSFEIEAGDVVGIIGANGAGKSTLLKILSRIVEPTRGEAEIHGRVGSLLEVGTGFHPELTGRENIFLNGVILGMKKPEIVRKFDEIVAFAEIDKFIDTPVKRYSSGMYVRLAFAVAAHLEAEILLVDEVLAVGDVVFQKKCLGAMSDIAKRGRTVLFVSHNMAAMAALCKRCFLLEGGRFALAGPSGEVIEQYVSRTRDSAEATLAERTDRQGTGRIRFTRATVLNHRLEPVPYVSSGQDIVVALDYQIASDVEIRNAYLQIDFFGSLGQPLFVCLSRLAEGGIFTLKAGGRILCQLPHLPLAPGVYTFSVWCKVGIAPGNLEDSIPHAGKIMVTEGDFLGNGQVQPKQNCDFLVDHQWSVVDGPEHANVVKLSCQAVKG